MEIWLTALLRNAGKAGGAQRKGQLVISSNDENAYISVECSGCHRAAAASTAQAVHPCLNRISTPRSSKNQNLMEK